MSESESPTPSGKKTEPVDLDVVIRPISVSELTKVTLEYEAPDIRQAREAKETVLAAREHHLTLLKLAFTGILLLGYFCLGIYLLSPKSGTTEEQKRFAENVLVAPAGAATGYAFGKRTASPTRNSASGRFLLQ